MTTWNQQVAESTRIDGLEQQTATDSLTDLGLRVMIEREASDSVPAGITSATEPTAGTSVAVDQPVTLIVSSGPA